MLEKLFNSIRKYISDIGTARSKRQYAAGYDWAVAELQSRGREAVAVVLSYTAFSDDAFDRGSNAAVEDYIQAIEYTRATFASVYLNDPERATRLEQESIAKALGLPIGQEVPRGA